MGVRTTRFFFGETQHMIWIGTSGWVYRHWIGCFYPPELHGRAWLAYYARHFSTVELNRSFYRLPTAANFRAWADQVGAHPGFVFAVKASRYLTHHRRLYGPEDPLARLMGAATALGWKLGPVLYQLPPGMPADLPRLAYFLAHLPPTYRAAFEFRDHSWFQPDVFRMLAAAGCALVRAIGGFYTPLEVPDTGPFRYLRVHGGLYGVGLTDGELDFWAARIAGEAAAGRDVYVYFNNDPDCHAVYDAFRLRDRLWHTGAVAP
jgi:uncharacterized protein YecE (DUF72 family)